MGKKSLSEIQKEIKRMKIDADIGPIRSEVLDVPRLSTGVLAVDDILGGGFPYTKMVELYGPHGSGKTSLAMRAIAEGQKLGVAALVDLENAFDPIMAENSGVNVDDLIVTQPFSAEDTFTIIETLLDLEDLKVIVVDSAAALVPKAELEGDYGDVHVGLVARLMSQAMRKLVAKLRTEHPEVVIVWINQIREKIGVMGFGPKTETPTGRALKFYSDIRVEVSRIENIKRASDDPEPMGHRVKVKAQKNRGAPPFRQATFDIYYDRGIVNESFILDYAMKTGVVIQKGAWFADTTTGENLGQGRLNVIERLGDEPELAEALLNTAKEAENG